MALTLSCVRGIGIPPFGYGQSYYTLRSIFMDRVPPPQIHMHIRKFDVATQVPIGDLSASHSTAIPNGNAKGSPKEMVETDIPPTERDKFDLWLRNLWDTKDRDMDRVQETGSFVSDTSSRIEIPIKIRSKRDVLDAFCFFVPALIGWIFSKVR